jgi:hypothetical protein
MMIKRLQMDNPQEYSSAWHHKLSDSGDAVMRGGGHIVLLPSNSRQSSFMERKTRSRPASFADQAVIHCVSPLEPLDDAPKSLGFPCTPRRSVSQMDGSYSPVTTPAWMKPFHLVDEEKSIYFHVHGEDWRDHALCMQCFRRHGNFHRMLSEGCEVCGQEEVLKSHYWEFPDRE